MSESTATTAGTSSPVSIEKMHQVMQELDRVMLAPPNEWVLVAPSGLVYRGKAEELLQVLMPYHPLLKLPSFMDMKP
jgi:hypothetical protein